MTYAVAGREGAGLGALAFWGAQMRYGGGVNKTTAQDSLRSWERALGHSGAPSPAEELEGPHTPLELP